MTGLFVRVWELDRDRILRGRTRSPRLAKERTRGLELRVKRVVRTRRTIQPKKHFTNPRKIRGVKGRGEGLADQKILFRRVAKGKFRRDIVDLRTAHDPALVPPQVFRFDRQGDRLSFRKDRRIDRIAIRGLKIDGRGSLKAIDREFWRLFEGRIQVVDRYHQRVRPPKPLAVEAVDEEKTGRIIGDLNQERRGVVRLAKFRTRNGLQKVEAVWDLEGIPTERPRLLVKLRDRHKTSDLTKAGGLRPQEDLDRVDRLIRLHLHRHLDPA